MLPRGIIVLLLTGITIWFCMASPAIRSGGEAAVIMELPGRVADFVGEKELPDEVELQVLPKDTEFAKMVYQRGTANPAQRDVANVSIVLSGADRKSIHRPEVCLTAQGWKILSSDVKPVELGDGRELRVKDLYISKSVMKEGAATREIRAHYIYWFAGTNVSTPDHVERTWITLRDNVLHGVNHRWAYPSVMGLVTEGFDPSESGQRTRTNEQTSEMLYELIRKLAPKFQKEYMDLAHHMTAAP